MDRLHDYDINDTVLNQDITRIKKSIDLLEGSLKSIKKLQANANGMKGLTSQAILHRTDDLERTITRLIKRLEQQIKLLQKIIIYGKIRNCRRKNRYGKCFRYFRK